MAMRENQLRALGMKTNALGQVKAENPILQQLVDMGLGEEPGPVCVICREGYRFQPGRVLAIYTFSRRCQLEDLESQLWCGSCPTSSATSSSPSVSSGRSRKTLGYYTVSHFNVVHVECHLSAVRLARARDEWESAALQNANTRCNGLLPLWGPQVPESAFATCLARHNTYLQECTGHRDIGYVSTCHDLKLLLLRFALERSFSDESGGGGPQSNMHFLPYLLHAALYVLNTTRSWSREEKNLKGFFFYYLDVQVFEFQCHVNYPFLPLAFLDTPRGEKWVENHVESDSAFYYTTLALLVQSCQRWNTNRLTFLGRLLVTAHCRVQQPKANDQRHEKQILDYSVYKPALVFFAIVNGIYNIVLKVRKHFLFTAFIRPVLLIPP
jgi:E3 ubiquitin-protein ligase UBR4